MYKLFHEKHLIGIIPAPYPDGLAMQGSVELTEKAADYKELFDYWVDDNKDPKTEEKFSDALFENWFVEDEDGAKHSIGLPAIFPENGKHEIAWRYL